MTSVTPYPKALFLRRFRLCSSPSVCENYSLLIANDWRRSGVDRPAKKRGALREAQETAYSCVHARKRRAESRSDYAIYEGSSTAPTQQSRKRGGSLALPRGQLFQLNAKPTQSGRRIVRRLAAMVPVPESVPHLFSAFRQFGLLFRRELAAGLRHYATV